MQQDTTSTTLNINNMNEQQNSPSEQNMSKQELIDWARELIEPVSRPNVDISVMFPAGRTDSVKKTFKMLDGDNVSGFKWFYEKWKTHPVEIILAPQEVVSSSFNLRVVGEIMQHLAFVDHNVDALIIISVGREKTGINIARRLVNAHPGSFILCDISGILSDEETLMPKNSFTFDVDAKNLKYNADISWLPSELVESLKMMKILNAGESIRYMLEPITKHAFMFDAPRLEIETCARLCEMLSLDLVKIPSLKEYDLEDSISSIQSRLLAPMMVQTLCSLSIPFDNNIEAYCDRVNEAASKLKDVIFLWKAALASVPFSLKIELREFEKYDADMVRDMATALGVSSMIEACIVHGLSVEDIVAGMPGVQYNKLDNTLSHLSRLHTIF